MHALEVFRRLGGGSVRIRRGAACLYRLNSQLGKLYNYNPRMISAAQKDIIRLFETCLFIFWRGCCDVKWCEAM